MSQERTFNKLAGLNEEQKFNKLWEAVAGDEEVTPNDYGFTLEDYGNIEQVKEWLTTQFMDDDTELWVSYGWHNDRPVINVIDGENITDCYNSGYPKGSHGTSWDYKCNELNKLRTEDGDYSEIRNKYLNK